MDCKKQNKSMIYNKPKLFTGIILIVLTIIFAIIAGCMYLHYNDNKYVECDYGFIVMNVDDYDETATIKYQDNNGAEHIIEVNYYSSSWSKGDIMAGKYNPNDYNDIVILATYTTTIPIFLSISVICLLIALMFIASQKKFEKNIENCKRKGTKYIAKVIETFESMYTVGSHHAEYLTCSVDYKGKRLILRSQNTFEHDLCKGLHHFDNASMSFIVNVYIIDEFHYYIDLNTMRVDEIDL